MAVSDCRDLHRPWSGRFLDATRPCVLVKWRGIDVVSLSGQILDGEWRRLRGQNCRVARVSRLCKYGQELPSSPIGMACAHQLRQADARNAQLAPEHVGKYFIHRGGTTISISAIMIVSNTSPFPVLSCSTIYRTLKPASLSSTLISSFSTFTTWAAEGPLLISFKKV